MFTPEPLLTIIIAASVVKYLVFLIALAFALAFAWFVISREV